MTFSLPSPKATATQASVCLPWLLLLSNYNKLVCVFFYQLFLDFLRLLNRSNPWLGFSHLSINSFFNQLIFQSDQTDSKGVLSFSELQFCFAFGFVSHYRCLSSFIFRWLFPDFGADVNRNRFVWGIAWSYWLSLVGERLAQGRRGVNAAAGPRQTQALHARVRSRRLR